MSNNYSTASEVSERLDRQRERFKYLEGDIALSAVAILCELNQLPAHTIVVRVLDYERGKIAIFHDEDLNIGAQRDVPDLSFDREVCRVLTRKLEDSSQF